tara:strand:+ start:2436 stop:2879 length:444 start_codon:yes stop_codon:yes gene_type:complete
MKTCTRIFVVENDPARVFQMRAWVPEEGKDSWILSHAPVGNIAARVLELDHPATWNGIALDHDLDSAGESIDPYNGLDVARVIVREVDKSVPILIHSMNPAGSSLMLDVLREAGFSVTRIPFSELTPSLFVEWLEECRGALEERVCA